MIYLVEKLNENNKPVLGTEGRYIFSQYRSIESLERYQLKRLVNVHGVLWVSKHYNNIYGEPVSVWKYEKSNNERGFTKCILSKEESQRY